MENLPYDCKLQKSREQKSGTWLQETQTEFRKGTFLHSQWEKKWSLFPCRMSEVGATGVGSEISPPSKCLCKPVCCHYRQPHLKGCRLISLCCFHVEMLSVFKSSKSLQRLHKCIKKQGIYMHSLDVRSLNIIYVIEKMSEFQSNKRKTIQTAGLISWNLKIQLSWLAWNLQTLALKLTVFWSFHDDDDDDDSSYYYDDHYLRDVPASVVTYMWPRLGLSYCRSQLLSLRGFVGVCWSLS